MDTNYKPSNLFIRKPRSLVLRWMKEPEQSLDALLLDDLLLSLAESHNVSYPAKYINSILPNLSNSDLRNNVLNELNSLVYRTFDGRSQLKVYEYVRCYKGQYTWAYTPEYVCYFLCAFIYLPGSKISEETYREISLLYSKDQNGPV